MPCCVHASALDGVACANLALVRLDVTDEAQAKAALPDLRS
jgi:hypothetical protein